MRSASHVSTPASRSPCLGALEIVLPQIPQVSALHCPSNARLIGLENTTDVLHDITEVRCVAFEVQTSLQSQCEYNSDSRIGTAICTPEIVHDNESADTEV